jgi:hypothetical protein
MINVKEAVAKATEQAQELLGANPSDLRLEEVEVLSRSQGNDVWAITLSMWAPSPLGSGHGFHRTYKTFMIDSQTGDFIAMKIRELASAQ